MSREEAHALLNAAKAGANIPPAAIVEALLETGDMSQPARRYTELGAPSLAPQS